MLAPHTIMCMGVEWRELCKATPVILHGIVSPDSLIWQQTVAQRPQRGHSRRVAQVRSPMYEEPLQR